MRRKYDGKYYSFTTVLLVQPEGHQEPFNEVGSQSTNEHISEIQTMNVFFRNWFAIPLQIAILLEIFLYSLKMLNKHKQT